MRSNFGLMGPVADGLGGLARIDDQRGAGYRHPVTEAGADANNYVCEFDGGASANETGVGLGLAGADLVLAQVGGVPGASGGYRQLAYFSKYFTVPTALIDACIRNAGGKWAILFQLADWTAITEQALFRAFVSSPAANLSIYQDWNGYIGQGRPAIVMYNAVGPMFNGSTTAQHPTSGAFWIAMWEDGTGNIRLGWKTGDQPQSWRDFPELQRMNTGISGAGWASFTGTNYMIAGDLKVKSVTLSKIPLGG